MGQEKNIKTLEKFAKLSHPLHYLHKNFICEISIHSNLPKNLKPYNFDRFPTEIKQIMLTHTSRRIKTTAEAINSVNATFNLMTSSRYATYGIYAKMASSNTFHLWFAPQQIQKGMRLGLVAKLTDFLMYNFIEKLKCYVNEDEVDKVGSNGTRYTFGIKDLCNIREFDLEYESLMGAFVSSKQFGCKISVDYSETNLNKKVLVGNLRYQQIYNI